jgi:hypothetical protein
MAARKSDGLRPEPFGDGLRRAAGQGFSGLRSDAEDDAGRCRTQSVEVGRDRSSSIGIRREAGDPASLRGTVRGVQRFRIASSDRRLARTTKERRKIPRRTTWVAADPDTSSAASVDVEGGVRPAGLPVAPRTTLMGVGVTRAVGVGVGAPVGVGVGALLEPALGVGVGAPLGAPVGVAIGALLEPVLGVGVGAPLGAPVGVAVGAPLGALEAALAVAVGVGPGPEAWFVMFAEQMTRAPPPLAEPLHWLILTAWAPECVPVAVQVIPTSVPPLAEPLHWVIAAPDVVAGKGEQPVVMPPPDPTH